MKHPTVIQGGMGAAVSSWQLANAVSRAGQLGVISGTAMATVLARRLQEGDFGGHMRRAMAHFPAPDMAQRVLDRYYVEGGKASDAPYRPVPMYTMRPSRDLQELTVVGNFVEVWLAKEGHDNPVGINLLTKIQMPNVMSLYGAMLAGVDYVLMGAGIPREIPGVLDALAEHRVADLKLDVEQALSTDDFRIPFDPRALMEDVLPPLTRPKFLAIIASATLAIALLKKGTGRIDGWIIEGPTAGGHNAPPRGAWGRNERGEPVYGPRDEVDLAKIKELGLPFWLAGSYAEPQKLKEALDLGAAGIQVGTIFALCEESGLAADLKRSLIEQALAGTADVYTDADASPTGFPFKVARLDGTNSEIEVYEARQRVCDLGYLRAAYKRDDGAIGFRCPSEPVDTFVKKGGDIAETVGRKCLCNGLMSNIGLGQIQKTGQHEKPLITAGDDLKNVGRILRPGQTAYHAIDVLDYLRTLPDGATLFELPMLSLAE